MRRCIGFSVFFFLALIALRAQVPDFRAKEFRKARMTICQVGEYPVGSENRSFLGEYVLDYQVQLQRDLTGPEADSLRLILSDSANYILTGMQKTCPFMGKYALKIRSKRSVIELVVSNPGCIKMILRSSAGPDVRYFDLTRNNSIYPALEKMMFRLEF